LKKQKAALRHGISPLLDDPEELRSLDFSLRIGEKILYRLDDPCLHPIVLQLLKYLLSREPGCPLPNFFIDFILMLFSCRYRFKPRI